jgi:hypothetical protein
MKRFDVIVRLDDDTRELAGVLAMGDPAANGRYAAEFRYEPTWPTRPRILPGCSSRRSSMGWSAIPMII